MRIEIYFAIDGNENVGVGFDEDEATSAMNLGGGPDRGRPVAIACFSVEMNAPKLIEGPLVVVPESRVQTIQPEIVEAKHG